MGLHGPKSGVPNMARFLNFVAPEPNTGCHFWIGATCYGYGIFTVKGKTVRAHRWIYEQEVGPIPAGLVIDHKCNIRCCVNSKHLRACTPRENTLAVHSLTDARRNFLKTHCRNGHEFDADNIYRDPAHPEWRFCRRCRILRTDVVGKAAQFVQGSL